MTRILIVEDDEAQRFLYHEELVEEGYEVGIVVMSFKGLVMFPEALGFAFQMLTAVRFYQFFIKIK